MPDGVGVTYVSQEEERQQDQGKKCIWRQQTEYIHSKGRCQLSNCQHRICSTNKNSRRQGKHGPFIHRHPQRVHSYACLREKGHGYHQAKRSLGGYPLRIFFRLKGLCKYGKERVQAIDDTLLECPICNNGVQSTLLLQVHQDSDKHRGLDQPV